MNGSMTAAGLFGCPPVEQQFATTGPAAVTQHMATPADGLSGWSALVHPDNPLFWIGVLGIVTVGLGSLAGRVRLGPASAAVKVGKG